MLGRQGKGFFALRFNINLHFLPSQEIFFNIKSVNFNFHYYFALYIPKERMHLVLVHIVIINTTTIVVNILSTPPPTMRWWYQGAKVDCLRYYSLFKLGKHSLGIMVHVSWIRQKPIMV